MKGIATIGFRFFRHPPGGNGLTIDVMARNIELEVEGKFIDITRLTPRGDGIVIRDLKELKEGYISGASKVNTYSRNITAIFLLYSITGNAAQILSLFDNIEKTTSMLHRTNSVPRYQRHELIAIANAITSKACVVKTVTISQLH
jgi:hypothetical protein